MINSRDDVKELIDEYQLAKLESYYQIWISETDEWDDAKKGMYINGVVLGKLREKDPATMKTLERGVSDEELEKEILQNIENNIQQYLRCTKELDIMQQLQLENYRRMKWDISDLSLKEWINRYCGLFIDESDGLTDAQFKTFLYLYYVFDNISNYRESLYYSDTDELENIYQGFPDVFCVLQKYGIIRVNDHMQLILLNPPRLYDKAIDRTFFVKNVPLNLLETLSDMMSRGFIGQFAVRVKNEPGYKGKVDQEYLCEALERGKPFTLSELGTYSVSKLYSDRYCDCLWIRIEPHDITFEEMDEAFDTYEDMIVTQVIHMQYERLEAETYITHLDHEYIFYTMDEYLIRQNNPLQKGNARPRIKSFKIDRARIPFGYRCEVNEKDENGNVIPGNDEQFLCYVLESYFKHTDLLNEYFSQVFSDENNV